jgi:hypothetical protein
VRDTSEKEKEMQYHYVVTYDSLNKTFTVDVDTADAVLHNGYFFDEAKQEWLDPDDERLTHYQEDYVEVEDKLAKVLFREHNPNCVHATVYENPDFENLTCLSCGADVEPSE